MELKKKLALADAMVRLNHTSDRTEIRRRWTIGALEIHFLWRSPKNFMGRFGGCWNWELGVQVGGSTVILNLLVFSLRFCKRAA